MLPEPTPPPAPARDASRSKKSSSKSRSKHPLPEPPFQPVTRARAGSPAYAKPLAEKVGQPPRPGAAFEDSLRKSPSDVSFSRPQPATTTTPRPFPRMVATPNSPSDQNEKSALQLPIPSRQKRRNHKFSFTDTYKALAKEPDIHKYIEEVKWCSKHQEVVWYLAHTQRRNPFC